MLCFFSISIDIHFILFYKYLLSPLLIVLRVNVKGRVIQKRSNIAKKQKKNGDTIVHNQYNVNDITYLFIMDNEIGI